MGTFRVNELLRHEPSMHCMGEHCYSCELDHSGPAWQWCLECGHAYRSPRDLRRAYRRKSWELVQGFIIPWFRSNEFTPSIARILWRNLTIRAKNIHFCQECSHDF